MKETYKSNVYKTWSKLKLDGFSVLLYSLVTHAAVAGETDKNA